MTAKELLLEKTGISYIKFTKRCNEAIKLALQIAKKLGKTKCFILDQGGWITYPQFAKKLGFKMQVIKTDLCKFDLTSLELLDSDSVLLLHSLSGYFYEQPMKEIYSICKEKDCLLINDCCGSISKKELLEGDFFVCSFGKWKPLNNGNGGFIGTKNKGLFEEIYFEEYDLDLDESLVENLDDHVNRINLKSKEIIKELEGKNVKVLNKSDLNLVVIALTSDSQTELVLEIAKKHGVDVEFCPREIRVNVEAISLEVKRLE